MLRIPLASLALTTLAVAPLRADVLTVGPGAQFTDIQDAIDDASPNDVVLVEPGAYGGISIDKPLRVLGDGSGTVSIESVESVGAVIEDLGAGEEVVLSGVHVEGTPVFLGTSNFAIHVRNCLGSVELHDVTVEPSLDQIALRVEHTTRAVLLASEIEDAGAPNSTAIDVMHSTLWVSDSSVTGTSSPFNLHLAQAGAHAIRLNNSTLHMWRSTLVGGDGNDVQLEAFGAAPGGRGIDATGSVVILYGGSVGSVQGGDGGSAPFFGVEFPGGAGVQLSDNSFARIQSGLPIAGGFDGSGLVQADGIGTDAISSAILDATIFATLSSSAQQLALGGNTTITHEGNPFGGQVLFAALGTGPDLILPGVDGIAILDAAPLFQLATVVLDAGGSATQIVGIPSVPALLGTTVFLQAGEASGTSISITNPVMLAVTS